MEDLTTLFCSVDDFRKQFEAHWTENLIGSRKPRRGPPPELSISEMITIAIMFHQSNYTAFKHFYQFVLTHLCLYFPKIISYNRFVGSMKNLFIPLFAYLLHRGFHQNRKSLRTEIL